MRVSSRPIEFLWFTLISGEPTIPPFSRWDLLSSSETLFLLDVEEVFWDAAFSSKIVMRKILGFVGCLSVFHKKVFVIICMTTYELSISLISNTQAQKYLEDKIIIECFLTNNNKWYYSQTINFTYLFSYGKSEGNWSCYVFSCYFFQLKSYITH